MGRNKIGPGGLSILGSSLALNCKKLQTLNLGGNSFQLQAAGVALIETFKSCSALEEIHLHDIKVGEEGADAFTYALSCCKSLRSLDLSGTEIKGASITALVASLKSCSTLQNLALNRNMVGSGRQSRTV